MSENPADSKFLFS